jgi:hypothetical protein
MTGLMQRIFRRRSSGPSRRGVAGLVPRLPAGLLRRRPGRQGMPWGKRSDQPALTMGSGAATAEVVETAGTASFRDRGRLRRRLRYLRRARELAFRDVGGLIFDMRRFGRDRPDLVDAKLAALAAVDQELRALERVLEDQRPIHELREPGLSSCPRCGALHASEDNFCPHCGLQIGGPQAMGEVGGAIAAPPQAPPAPIEQPTAQTLIAPGVADADAAAAAAAQTPAADADAPAAPAAAAAQTPAASAAGAIRIADDTPAPPSDETLAGRIADNSAAFDPAPPPSADGDGGSPQRSADGDGGSPQRSADGTGDPTPPEAQPEAEVAPAGPDEPQPTEILRQPDAP